MSNLLDKSSIVLTPTAYDNSKVLCVKPSDASGDFQFSRNSAATRVNAQGLVENVQILSSNLVQNGDFSEEGVQEVSNGSFSQEGAELITNGDFSVSTGWQGLNADRVISDGKLNISQASGFAVVYQPETLIVGTYYKCVVEVSNYVDGSFKIGLAGSNAANSSPSINADGTFTFYLQRLSGGSNNVGFVFGGLANLSIDNFSVREVGQDWTIASGSGWSIGENKLIGINANSSTYQGVGIQANKTYKIQFTVLDYVSGSVRPLLNGSTNVDGTNVSANGTYTQYLTSTSNSNGNFSIRGISFNGSVTNISVKEVAQNWTSPDYNSALSIVGGQLKIVSTVSLGRVVQAVTTVVGKTYLASANITNIDSSTGIQLKLSNGANLDGAFFNSSFNTTTNIVTIKHNFVATATTTYIGTSQGSSVGQSGLLGNVSVIQITDDTNLPRISYEGFSYQDALGSELITNGDFATDGSWVKGTGWTISGGSANGSSTTGDLYQENVVAVGKKYKVTYTISNYVSGSVRVELPSNAYAGIERSANGTYTETILSGGTIVLFDARTSFTGSIDNVSVKEYLGQEVVPDSGCGSWLFEPQSTNLVTDSEDYSQWTPTGVSVTSNSTTSPDGLINGTLLSTNGGTSNRYIRNFGLSTSATIKVLSVYAKANLSNFIQLFHSGDGQGYVNFDVSNGVVGTSGTKTTGEIKSVGNGWYRCIAYFDSSNVFGASSFVALVTSNSAGYSGGATSDDLNVYIWGSQYEEQSYATSYIPTDGSTVTRNQDVCTNGGSLASINSTEGVLYAEIAALADGVGTRTMSLSDGTNNNSITIRYTTNSGIINAFIVAGGFIQFSANISGVSVLNFNKVAIKYSLNNMALWINGVEVATDTSGTMPLGLNEINFTRGDGANKFFGKTKALAVWKEALSDSELQSLTTI